MAFIFYLSILLCIFIYNILYSNNRHIAEENDDQNMYESNLNIISRKNQTLQICTEKSPYTYDKQKCELLKELKELHKYFSSKIVVNNLEKMYEKQKISNEHNEIKFRKQNLFRCQNFYLFFCTLKKLRKSYIEFNNIVEKEDIKYNNSSLGSKKSFNNVAKEFMDMNSSFCKYCMENPNLKNNKKLTSLQNKEIDYADDHFRGVSSNDSFKKELINSKIGLMNNDKKILSEDQEKETCKK